MIHEVTGDILLTKAHVIAHGVAPNDDFTSVLAHSLREQWPAMYKDFRHYCHTMHPKPGEIWVWANPEGKRIVNLFTQEAAYGHGVKPGRAREEYVNHALRALHKAVASEKFTSMALPRLATGVGGIELGKRVSPDFSTLRGTDYPCFCLFSIPQRNEGR